MDGRRPAPVFWRATLQDAMLHLSRVAAEAWESTDGSGASEVPPRLRPVDFKNRVASAFTSKPVAVSEVRSFVLDATGTLVTVNTNGRRPSAVTVRTIKATFATLHALYGPCPHAAVDFFLMDDPSVKVFPRRQPVTVDHVNSGFSQGAVVVAYRCSEMHRTIVHELLHVWKTHSQDRPDIQRRATAILGAPEGCLVTEAFVEAVTWLIHGGFCPRGLDPDHAIRVARRYLLSPDDGQTNGWAYFVGKAMLVHDGGKAFHRDFFEPVVRLMDRQAHRALLALMVAAKDSVDGADDGHDVSARMCDCSLGDAFAKA